MPRSPEKENGECPYGSCAAFCAAWPDDCDPEEGTELEGGAPLFVPLRPPRGERDLPDRAVVRASDEEGAAELGAWGFTESLEPPEAFLPELAPVLLPELLLLPLPLSDGVRLLAADLR